MSVPKVNLPHFLRALSSRNYRLYFAGQCVSLLGNWITTTSALWLAYHLSGNAFYVGLVGFANQAPVLILAPFAGVWVDRVDPLRVIRFTQVLAMVQSAALAAFTLMDRMTVPLLIGLVLMKGAVNALDWPARQTLTIRLAGGRALLDNVIALNSLTFNLARLVGPAVAGFVIAAVGPGLCFALDAVSYVAVLAALAALRLQPFTPRRREAHPLADLRDGVRYAWTHPAIRRVLLMVAVIALAGFSHSVLAPVFAEDVFDGDARTLGFMLSATGVGAVLAGIFLSSRASGIELRLVVACGAALGGVGLVSLGAVANLSLALVCFAAAGAGGVLVMASSNTILQPIIDDDKRGRVMGLFTMAQSMFPVGSLLVGALAHGFGARIAIAGAGIVCVAAAGIFFRQPALHSPSPSTEPATANR